MAKAGSKVLEAINSFQVHWRWSYNVLHADCFILCGSGCSLLSDQKELPADNFHAPMKDAHAHGSKATIQQMVVGGVV